MKRINIKAISKASGLSLNEIAQELFPGNKYARFSLNRVIKKETSLNEDQISRLSAITAIPIGSLFSGDWKQRIEKDTHTFENGDYRAVLNIRKWTTQIFHKNSIAHDEIVHEPNILLSDYFDLLDSLIIKFSTNADFKS